MSHLLDDSPELGDTYEQAITTGKLRLGLPADDTAKPTKDDLTLWSVTTIIGTLDKPALIYWAANQTATAAVRAAASLTARIEEDGPEETAKWLAGARYRTPPDRLRAADLGTVCHTACEEYALTGTRPDNDRIAALIRQTGLKGFDGVESETVVLNQMLDRFDRWLQRFTPSYQATEVAVYSPKYGYAGTCDSFLTIGDVRFITDYKTTREPYDSRGKPKKPYPEVALQLAAYRYAEMAAVWRPRRTEKWRRRYYLLSPPEQDMAQPVPEVDGGLCIHITPEACEAYPVRCDVEAHRAFLYTLECFRWVQETSKTAIGPPLETIKETT